MGHEPALTCAGARAAARAMFVLLPAAMTVAGCSTTKYGFLSLEGRGEAAFGHDPNKFQAVELATAQGTGFDAPQGISGNGVPDPSFKARGLGLQLALQSPWIDLTAGIEQRRFENESVPETSVGLRKRFGVDENKAEPYVFVLAREDRRGTEPDSGFNGTSFGFGVLAHLSRRWFIDWNLGWERTGHLDIEPGHSRRQEGVMQFGLGFSL